MFYLFCSEEYNWQKKTIMAQKMTLSQAGDKL